MKSLTFLSNQVILQIESDQDQVGRVFGIQSSLTNAVLIISPAMSGPLVHLFGVTQLYVYGGIGLVIIGVIGVSLQKYLWAKHKHEPIRANNF